MNFKSGSLVTAFVGVNIGYQGDDAEIQSPEKAVQIVTEEVSTLDFDANIYQGYAVYPTSWGCPVGGEVIAAVFAESDGKMNIQRFDDLKSSLQQTSLAVVSSYEHDGQPTEGFTICLGNMNLANCAAKWQQLAQQENDSGGSYLCGVVYSKDGKVYAQAEANPNEASSNYVPDIEKWKADVRTLFSKITSEAQPSFKRVGFNYLRS